MAASVGEETLAQHLRAAHIPFTREFRFHPDRKWRSDFLVEPKILVEVEGVNYDPKNPGRHQRARGLENDCAKYNAAVLAGYAVLRFTPAQVKAGDALCTIEALRAAQGV